MSPRRNRPPKQGRAKDAQGAPDASDEEERPFSFTGGSDHWQGEEWIVRPVAGGAFTKRYRCPGCDQEIAPGVGHVVAWREYGGADDRRHWHRACWAARDRRTSRVQRSRNAPRY